MMNGIILEVNNGRTLEVTQEKRNSDIFVSATHRNGTHDNDGSYIINAGEFTMLLNLYLYIKDNDIQNDFINPYGKNKEE